MLETSSRVKAKDKEDKDFKNVYASLIHGKPEENYFLHEQLLYHLGKLYIPEKERAHVI